MSAFAGVWIIFILIMLLTSLASAAIWHAYGYLGYGKVYTTSEIKAYVQSLSSEMKQAKDMNLGVSYRFDSNRNLISKSYRLGRGNVSVTEYYDGEGSIAMVEYDIDSDGSHDITEHRGKNNEVFYEADNIISPGFLPLGTYPIAIA